MPPPNTITFHPSQLKMQRLTEELQSGHKKLKEYEDMFSALYHNACGHCKVVFQRIASAGVSESSLAVATPWTPASDSLHGSSSSTPPVEDRSLKRRQTSLSESSTDRHNAATSHKLKRPRYFIPPCQTHHQCVATVSCVGAPEPHHGSSATSTEHPKVSATPPGEQAQYFVKFPSPVGKPTLQMKLEHLWTHETKETEASVKFSPDGKYLAVGLIDRNEFHSPKTYIYDMINAGKICLADRYPRRNYYSACPSFSPGDGRYLATGHWSANTMIWEVGKKRVRNAFACRAVDTCADISPDGRLIATSSISGEFGVRMRSMRDGSSILLRDHNNEMTVWGVLAVKFSPDGKLVVASSMDGMLRLWNVRTSKMVGKWKAHQGFVYGVAFTPNGRGLVTANYGESNRRRVPAIDDQVLKYWDLGNLPGVDDLREVTAMEVPKFDDHSMVRVHEVRSVAISRDSRWLVTASDDGITRIWDIPGGLLQCLLVGHAGEINTVDFCPTSDYVACGDSEGNVSVWSY